MKLDFPKLDLPPGKTFCLHIPHGFHEEEPSVEAAILRAAMAQGKSVVISRPASRRSGFLEFFHRQTSVEWLAKHSGASEFEAARVISEFGVGVVKQLSGNAGTPRCLLGIAAALARKPDVLIYSDQALDLSGCNSVHQYIRSKCGGACVVHVSLPSIHGDGRPASKHCPEGATCISLEPRQG